MSLPSHRNDLETPRGKSRRGPFNWHLRRPEQGPVSLAIKNHFIAMVGEYVGTVLFLMFAFGGTNVALIPTTSVTGSTTEGQDGSAAATVNTSNLLFIALCFGFALMVTAWIFFRVSGGLFNPAVSLGMVLVGALTPLRGALLSFVQILGAITQGSSRLSSGQGAAIIQALTPGTLNVRTTLGGGTSIAQGLFMEMFLTSLLMLAILLLAAEKHKATYIAPVGIGLALFVAELFGVYYTGGSLNPARSFGPAVVLRDFSDYHWIYWVGPGLGATIAAGFYKMLKFLQYETVLGPEADADVVPPPAVFSGAAVDPEKTAAVRTLAVTGPGLDDLLTTSLTRDSRQETADVEDRLSRIEMLLSQLVELQGVGSGSEARPNRVSNSTFVDQVGTHKTGTKYPRRRRRAPGTDTSLDDRIENISYAHIE
ncbi:hypothetical protein EHS25_000350 [Saitozyma podzolica]|uniref:Aquaporin n=1 Tax=Saitozyma podzolica TaxID=1890683 RepID=A0A427YVV0_9TREE|nr:hypothetical protein EHS25_000350 [Saitozyma podzolica]